MNPEPKKETTYGGHTSDGLLLRGLTHPLFKPGTTILHQGQPHKILSVAVRDGIVCYSLGNGIWAYQEEVRAL